MIKELVDNNILVNNTINTLLSENYVFTRVIETCEQYKDTFIDILDHRTDYEDTAVHTPYERDILKIYDLISTFHDDKELTDGLFLTCLWRSKFVSSVYEEPTFSSTNEQGKIQIKWDKLTNYLLEKYCMITWSGIRYIYIDSRFYEDGQGKYKKDILLKLQAEHVSESRKVEDIIREVNSRLGPLTTKYDDFPFNKFSDRLIPVKNGVVHIKTGILLPHSPAWGFTYCLPVIYDPSADATKIKNYLSSLMDQTDDQEILIQIPAHALLGQTKEYELAYALIGNGSNGKSTYIRLLRGMIGRSNVCAISLQDITNDKFKIAELHGKLMNLYPDLPSSDIKSAGSFKATTGGDEITVERKFGHPFQMQNHAVMVFSANKLPVVNDDTDAFWKRWNILEFNKKFPIDPDFDKKMFTDNNISGFFNLVLNEIKIIDQRKGLKQNKKADEMKDAWKKSSNSVYAYIKSDKWEKGDRSDPDNRVQKDAMYNDYLTFCKDGDMISSTKKLFTEQILFEFKCEEKRITIGQEIKPYIIGIRVKSP